MRRTAVVSPPPPRFATISLVSDSEGHKPKRYEKNSCGLSPPPRFATISLVSDSEGHKPKCYEKNSCGFSPPPALPLSRSYQTPRVINPSVMRTAVVSASPPPRFATILLVPDSEGHKPKRNKNNSCGVTQQHNKLLSDWPVLSIMVHKQRLRICLVVNGPLTKATCN